MEAQRAPIRRAAAALNIELTAFETDGDHLHLTIACTLNFLIGATVRFPKACCRAPREARQRRPDPKGGKRLTLCSIDPQTDVRGLRL